MQNSRRVLVLGARGFSQAPQHNSPQLPSKQQTAASSPPDCRFNPIGIQMLPKKMYRQIFGFETNANARSSIYDIRKCMEHLRRHDLLPLETKPSPQTTANDYNIVMDIPKLEGSNIDTHFNAIGRKYSAEYLRMARQFITDTQTIIANMPTEWSYESGWTRYEFLDSGQFNMSKVDSPLEDTLVFDVEICINDSKAHVPTLAVAVSSKAWYSWSSPRLIRPDIEQNDDAALNMNDLISFNSTRDKEKLIIGHNVGFDRSFLSDQYMLTETKTKFLDTLSLHMCVCGLTGLQRAFKCAQKRKIKDGEELDPTDINNNAWIQESCLNNLADVYEFHCGKTISKDDRETFVKGSLKDVRDNFQTLVTYCANDVKATFDVFKTLFSIYTQRFPHPVTLAGMLEMSTMYLPVDANDWTSYIERSQAIYDECENQLNTSLQLLANAACSRSEDDVSQDIWLWDLDQSKQSMRPNKSKLLTWEKSRKDVQRENSSLDDRVQEIYDTSEFMRQVLPFKPGFPKWYRELCCPAKKASELLRDREWEAGPVLITPQMRITPKLMQLTWQGYPLHCHQKHGWGYLVPNDDIAAQYIDLPEEHPYRNFPTQSLRKFCQNLPRSHILLDDGQPSSSLSDDLVRQKIQELQNLQVGTANFIRILKKISKKKKISPRLKGHFCPDVDIPGAYFIRLPHRNGPNFNVGNPLSKDFISKMEDGTLSSFDNNLGNLLLRHSSSLSYWKNNKSRIKKQMVVALSNDTRRAAILPRVIVAGTVTRRAVEPTWLTASNHDTSRVGSELKAMITTPPGHCFVGADVDSQELWIASLMGDSYSYRIHGGTGLSYMTLRGNKSNKTDMHSKTASLIGVSRNDAKVLNYARIYGAGQKFVERFLINTNPQLNEEEAKEKARTIFKETKGVRKFYFVNSSMNSVSQPASAQKFDNKSISIPINISENDRLNFMQDLNAKRDVKMYWEGGTESATFNKLEEIASSHEPRTPVLHCQISKALEPSRDQSKDFSTSRVNWVVQSSAVDFLHLVLVNMKWLFHKLNIDGRFSLSIHDEVRYIVKEEDRYKAAFALQVSNLMVRAYFAYKLNMKDLPIAVAFFSNVDIDKCLRKEVDMDCKSPSNPYGLNATYNIPYGESLDIKKIVEKYSFKAY